MADKALTKEEFGEWLTPMDALAILRGAFDDDYAANPRQTLTRALAAGLFPGVAARTSRQNGRIQRELEPIPARVWETITLADSVWTTGHTRFGERGPNYSTIAVDAFEVRFPSDAVNELVPKSSVSTAQENKSPPLSESSEPSPATSGPAGRKHPPKPKDQKPVSEAALYPSGVGRLV